MVGAFDDESLLGRLHRHATELADVSVYTFLADTHEPETLTFAQLSARVRTIAARLAEQARPGERALLLYPQGLEFICAFLGCLAAGAIAVPAYPNRKRGKSERLNGIIADCSPVAILTASSLRTRIEDQHGALPIIATDEWATCDAPAWPPARIARDTTAFLQYTSGSTGAPRGVAITHGNIACNQRQIQEACGHVPSSRGAEATTVVSWLPLFHDMGLIGGALQALYVGFPAVLMPATTFLQQPVKWLRAISDYRGTTSVAPNFAYEHCVRSIKEHEKDGLDLSSLRVLCNGAEPVRADTLDRFAAAFAHCGFKSRSFLPCYGLAEATLLVSGGPRQQDARRLWVASAPLEQGKIEAADRLAAGSRCLVSCGAPVAGAEIAIVDPVTRRASPVEHVGEIWVKSGAVAAGYWNREAESTMTFENRRADSDDGPFLATGDLGFLREGELYVTGRLKDVIAFRGRNLYPQDIEAAVSGEVAAIGPNCCAAFAIEAGETEGIALVVEAERSLARLGRAIGSGNGEAAPARAEFDQILTGIRGRISDEFEAPVRKVVVVRPGTFPRTTSGKVRRAACREGLLAGSLEVIYSWEVGRLGIAHHEPMVGNAHPTVAGTVTRLTEPTEISDGPEGRPRPTEEVAHNGMAPRCNSEQIRASIRAALVGWLRREIRASAETLSEETPFTSFGLDSIGAATVALDIQKATGVRVSPEAIYQHPTLAQLADHVAGKLPGAVVSSVKWAVPDQGLAAARVELDDDFAVPTNPAPAGQPSHDYRRLLDETRDSLTSGDDVSDSIWRLCAGLCAIRSRSPKSRWNAIAKECREHPLIDLLHQDPYAARAFTKPCGYPGDAGVIDYVYRMSPSLEQRRRLTPLGSAILNVTMEVPLAHAVRERRRLSARQIDIIAARKRRPTIMAVGAGHAREVVLSTAVREGRVGRFLAIDQDERSLGVIRDEYGSLGVECLALSVQDILQGSRPPGEADLVYALGLYDYLTETVAQRLTSDLFQTLAPGGTLLIANLTPGIVEAGYMEAVSDWHLTYRTPKELEGVADGIDASEILRCELWTDDFGCVAYLRITRRGDA